MATTIKIHPKVYHKKKCLENSWKKKPKSEIAERDWAEKRDSLMSRQFKAIQTRQDNSKKRVKLSVLKGVLFLSGHYCALDLIKESIDLSNESDTVK